MKFRNILSICVSGILVLSACEDLLNTDRTGQAIRFGVSTGSGLRTRTEYKGKQDDGRELIYWKEDGSDDVTIHMFWDGDGGADGEVKNYYVSNAYVSPDKSICKGNLSPTADGSLLWKGDFSGGDGKAHEYKHSFYSVYPANSATFKKDGKQFEFELKESLSGVDMSKAYMAAGLENVTSENSPVLQYYPMITTLYVTLVNDTDNAVTPGNIVLTSTDKPICGKYTVAFDADEKKFTFKEALESGKKTVTINVGNQLQPKGKTDIAFFIIPQEYNSSTLSFKINGKEHNFGDSYKSNLVGAYKYNITVYLSEKEPDIEEPEIVPPVIDNALAQLIFALLNPSNGSETSWPAFEEFWKEYFDYTGYSDFHSGFWQDLSKAISETKFDDMADKLKELFPGDKLTGLLDYLGKLETVSVTNSNLPKLSSSSLDLSIFKKAKKIDLSLTESDMKLNVSGLNDLESIEVTATGGCHEIELNVTDCPSFKKVKMNGDAPNKKILNLTGTPKFEEGEISTGSGKSVEITLIDCSTEVENGGVITLSSADANVTVSRKPRKEGKEVNVNVDVVAGYWEYWPEYKYAEKHW